MLNPWKGLRCWPLIAPSTSRLDRSVRSETRAMASGSEYLGDGGIGGSLPDRDVAQEPLDDRVARFAGGLGVVVDDDPVAEDRTGDGPDVLDGDAGSPRERGARLGGEDQRLPGARPGAPGDPLPDVGRAAVLGAP